MVSLCARWILLDAKEIGEIVVDGVWKQTSSRGIADWVETSTGPHHGRLEGMEIRPKVQKESE